MSGFRYRALLKNGEVQKGVVQGSSRSDAMRRLNEKGMQILSIEEEEGKREETARESTTSNTAAKKGPKGVALSSKQVIQFTEELSDLLSAGVTLDKALSSIGNRSENEGIKAVAERCHEQVRDGVSLASALRVASHSFDQLYCNLIAAGEVSGALSDILKRQVRYLNTLIDLKGKLVTALIYPAFLVVSGIAVAAMFTFFLIPKLRRLVESTGGELPFIANMMLGLGDFVKGNWIVLLGLLVIAAVVLVFAFQRENVKRWWDEAMLKIPLVGKLLLTRFNVQFVETLSNLLSNGLPLVKALGLVEKTTGNRYIREKIFTVSERVSEGASLCRSMEKTGVFESGLIDMVRIGEDTGQLTQSMNRAGERLDREFGRSVDRISAVIQPAIILVMAAVVGVMAYMMISVIYGTISVLRNQ